MSHSSSTIEQRLKPTRFEAGDLFGVGLGRERGRVLVRVSPQTSTHSRSGVVVVVWERWGREEGRRGEGEGGSGSSSTSGFGQVHLCGLRGTCSSSLPGFSGHRKGWSRERGGRGRVPVRVPTPVPDRYLFSSRREEERRQVGGRRGVKGEGMQHEKTIVA